MHKQLRGLCPAVACCRLMMMNERNKSRNVTLAYSASSFRVYECCVSLEKNEPKEIYN